MYTKENNMAKRKKQKHWLASSNRPAKQQPKSLTDIIINSDTPNLQALKNVIDMELEKRLNETKLEL